MRVYIDRADTSQIVLHFGDLLIFYDYESEHVCRGIEIRTTHRQSCSKQIVRKINSVNCEPFLVQSLNFQTTGQFIENLAKLRAYWNALGNSFLIKFPRAFSRETDLIEAGQSWRGLHHVPDIVDLFLEGLYIREPSYIQGHDGLPAIAGGFGIFCIVHHVPAKRRAVQSPSEQTKHEGKSISFWASDWDEEPFTGTLRIGQRLTLSVDHPAFRNGFIALRHEPDFAQSGVGGGHVKHDGRMPRTGDGDSDRISAEQCFCPAPGRHEIGI